MVDLLKKRLKLVFEDGFLISRTFFGPEFETDPRFFDSIYTLSIFGNLGVVPISGALELYYEKVEIDTFREFLIKWEPDLANFDPHNLSPIDTQAIIQVATAYSPEEKRDAISQFYGMHTSNVVNFLNKWLGELPNQYPYEDMIGALQTLRARLLTNFRSEDFEKRITNGIADELFNYWTSSSMNYVRNPFGPFGKLF